VVLAGGKSKRFGKNKLIQPFFGKTVLGFIVEKLSPFFKEVLIVCKNPLSFPKLKVFKTEICEEFTPICGILHGLKNCKTEKVVVVPGDSPFLKPKLLQFLSKSLPPACFSFENKIVPLPALFHKNHLFFVEKNLKEGKLSVKELHGLLKSNRISVSFAKIYDPTLKFSVNINRREDYESAYRFCC
jgi:molybdopterin-guanine dinucleotide biosynthesis protein A